MMEKMILDYTKSIVWVVVVWAVMIRWVVTEKVLRPRRRLPPGPTPLPIIGNLHNLVTDKPHKALADLAKVYGPLMYLRLGYLDTVVVSSPAVAREVMQKKDARFFGRTVPDCARSHQIPDHSMILMPVNPRWRTFRKIVTTLLFSSKSLDSYQNTRMKKIEDLVSRLSRCSRAGVAVDVGQVAFDTSLNLLSNTFFSMDLADPDSELSREFKYLTSEISRESGKPNLATFFPIFMSVDPQGLKRRTATHVGKLLSIFDIIIDKRLAARNNGEPQSNDMLDALLNICSSKSEDLELHHIRYILVDVFGAGTDTTSSTLEWAMAELLHQPNKLEATQAELHRVVGRRNFVKEADFARLPYLEAVIKEIFRMHPALSLMIPRKADSDTDVHAFTVPKGSQVLVNVWAMGRDPSLWKNPDKFEPERFLNSEIDVKGNHFELIPFGGGRRICPGLSLALKMLPLMLGNLINLFEWKLEDGVSPEAMDMDEKFGITLQKATPLYAIPVSI